MQTFSRDYEMQGRKENTHFLSNKCFKPPLPLVLSATFIHLVNVRSFSDSLGINADKWGEKTKLCSYRMTARLLCMLEGEKSITFSL